MKHGELKCVQNEGMPMYKEPFEKGQLFIKFEVSNANHLVHQCDKTEFIFVGCKEL